LKSIKQTLKEIFAPVAAALAIAVPLAAASAPAQAAVMETGPTRVVLQQLKNDGYTPVGGGQIASQDGRTTVSVIYKNAQNDWIATRGNDRTTQVIGRGTGLEIGKWAYTVPVSLNTPVDHEAGATSQCMPYEQVRENYLKNAFTTADLIQGTLQNGERMQIYANGGKWASLTIKQDAERTTCRTGAGNGFILSSQPTPAASLH